MSIKNFFKSRLAVPSRDMVVDGVRASESPPASAAASSAALAELRRRLSDRKTWIPDAVSSDCYSCQAKFTAVRRRHHCRMCGQIFCSRCCGNFIAGRSIGFTSAGSIRVCVLCHEYITRNIALDAVVQGQEVSEDRDLRAASEEMDSGGGGGDRHLRRNSAISALDLRFAAEDPAQATMAEEAALSSESFRLSDPRMLQRLMESITKREGGVTLGTRLHHGGAFHNCFTGSELVDWIRKLDDFVTTERSAKVLCQALLSNGYIGTFEDSSGNGVFESDDTPYRPTKFDKVTSPSTPMSGSPSVLGPLQEERNSVVSPTTDEEDDSMSSFPDWLRELESHSGQNTLDRKRDKRDKSRTREKSQARAKKTSDQRAPIMSTLGQLVSTQKGTNETKIEDLRKKTADIYKRHTRQVLTRLLEKESLDAEKWLPFLETWTEKIASDIDPYSTMEEVDVRRFVKVKRHSGGSPADSSYVTGEVFSNRLVRAHARASFDQPKMVLIEGSVRPREHDDKVAPVASVAYREKEYANAFCCRVLALAPNVILVGGSVSRLVRQTLEANDIEVLSGVKLSVLVRISQLFRVDIFRESSAPPGGGTEELALEKMKVGRCASFKRMPCLDDSTKEYIFVEGSKSKYGCTILLRGGDADELCRVKRVIWTILPYQRNARFEPAFLMTCGANTAVTVEPLSDIELSMSPFVRLRCREGLGKTCSEDSKPKLTPRNNLSKSMHNILGKENKIDCDKDNYEENVQSGTVMALSDDLTLHGTKRKKLFQNRANVAFLPVYGREGLSSDCDKPKHSKQKCTLEEDVKGSYIYILFSSYDKHSSAAPHHCIRPFPFKMLFYSSMDLALGKFLDHYVFCDEYRCPNHKICKTHINTHIRTFCNGNRAVRMDVSRVDESAFASWHYGEGDIVVWKFCPACRLITEVMPLRDDAYMVSFAVFLALLMHETELRRRGSTADSCKHLLNGDHLTCFAKKGIVASFQRNDIICPVLRLPTNKITVPEPYVDSEVLSEEATHLGTHGKMIYNAIFDEIKKIMSCGIPLLEESAGLYLQEQSKSHNEFRELMNTLGASQQRQDYLQEGRALVFKIRKHLCRSIMNWKEFVTALQEKCKKEIALTAGVDSRSRKESGSSRDQASNSSSSTSIAGANLDTPTKAKVEEALMPLPKHQEFIYKAPFSDTHHYCLSSWQSMLVDESQISSIIAYALSSPDHKRFLESQEASSQEARGTPKSGQRQHFHLSFSDETCKFFCCSYFAREFHQLREAIFARGERGNGSLLDFAVSLSECQPWDTSGGKSGSAFYKTRDDRFILKEMNSYEASVGSFEPFMARYFDYVHGASASGQPSCMAKILGVYKVAVNNVVTGNSYKLDLLVIENLFFGRNIRETFDLKGSIRNRMVDTSTVADSNLVLWDENLLKTMCERPLYLSAKENARMLEAISYDTYFLRSNHMMDYSMLLGITHDRRELVVGIVDYIRAFTWDKKVEQLLKQSGILGRGDRRQPTCVDPGLYMERFKEAMYKYFITVPDFCYRGVPPAVQGHAEEPLPLDRETGKRAAANKSKP